MEINIYKDELEGEVIKQLLAFTSGDYEVKVQFFKRDNDADIPDKLRAAARCIERLLSRSNDKDTDDERPVEAMEEHSEL